MDITTIVIKFFLALIGILFLINAYHSIIKKKSLIWRRSYLLQVIGPITGKSTIFFGILYLILGFGFIVTAFFIEVRT